MSMTASYMSIAFDKLTWSLIKEATPPQWRHQQGKQRFNKPCQGLLTFPLACASSAAVLAAPGSAPVLQPGLVPALAQSALEALLAVTRGQEPQSRVV